MNIDMKPFYTYFCCQEYQCVPEYKISRILSRKSLLSTFFYLYYYFLTFLITVSSKCHVHYIRRWSNQNILDTGLDLLISIIVQITCIHLLNVNLFNRDTFLTNHYSPHSQRPTLLPLRPQGLTLINIDSRTNQSSFRNRIQDVNQLQCEDVAI